VRTSASDRHADEVDVMASLALAVTMISTIAQQLLVNAAAAIRDRHPRS
jgi:hypothetical protein